MGPLNIAWLRPPLETGNSLDSSAHLIAGLSEGHDIEVIDAERAHDVVWRHARRPFDVFVHELSGAPGHAFVAPYAIHFPGVLLLRDFGPHHARAIQASCTVVVGDEAVAAELAESFPGTRVVAVPAALPEAGRAAPAPRRAGAVRFGVLSGRRAVVDAAAARAREAGAPVEILERPPAALLAEADVLIALDWPPPAGPPPAAVAAMAHGKPVVFFETLATAGWPSLDPQTWQPRGFVAGPPAAGVSIDPRDEEHSLMLAMRRLSGDAGLRDQLGTAARAWSAQHATMAHAIGAWRRILDAPGLPPSPPFPGADGSEHLRATLAEFGVTVDLL